MKIKVRVLLVEEVPIFCYKHVDGELIKSDRVERVETREKVLFSGSKAAFSIWKEGNYLPPEATISHRQTDIQMHKYVSPGVQECFAQDSIFNGR